MITTAEALGQIQRLIQLRGYPKGDEGAAAREDLVAELQQAKDLPEAKQIIRDFMETADPDTQCPTMAQIHKAVVSRLEEFRYDPDCPLCQGAGAYEKVPGRGYVGCKCLARRPAPVYRRDPETVRAMSEEISKVAAAKRMGD